MLLGGDCETNYVSGWRRQNSTGRKLQQRRRHGHRFTERGEARYAANLGLLTSFTEARGVKEKTFFFFPSWIFFFFFLVGKWGGGLFLCCRQ